MIACLVKVSFFIFYFKIGVCFFAIQAVHVFTVESIVVCIIKAPIISYILYLCSTRNLEMFVLWQATKSVVWRYTKLVWKSQTMKLSFGDLVASLVFKK